MSERSTIRRHPERAVPGEVAEILREGLVAHVAFHDGRGPCVIPMNYHVEPGAEQVLWLHGAVQSRIFERLAAGGGFSVGVTLLDGLVYSRTALYHSVNYRSCVGFGTRLVETTPDHERRLLEGLIARCFPGRAAGRDYDPIPEAHREATRFAGLVIDEWSAKARRGGPKGPRDADPDAPGSAGVVPLAARG